MQNMKIVGLLPMKGHSERVPNKNLKKFGGQPLYHAVAHILQSSFHISKFLVNTDSTKIKEDVEKNFSKAIVIDRPESIQGDFVSMNKIIEYDIEQTEEQHFLQTHSTNPLLQLSTMDKAIEKYAEVLGKGYDSLFSVTAWQTRFYWENGEAINHNPKKLERTQDLPLVYEENSNFYIFSKDSFSRSGKKRIGLNPWMQVVDKLESIDIDNPEDFKLAEILYNKKK